MATDESTLDMPDISDESKYNVRAAEISGAHGVSGNMRVKLIGANEEVAYESIVNSKQILLSRENPPFKKLVSIGSLRQQDKSKGMWIIKFPEITDRTEAEQLYGCAIMVTEEVLPKLTPGEYYVDELIGMKVITNKDRQLGELTEVIHAPANDVYVTSLDAMIPAVSAFVISIDTKDRKIIVNDVPGLVDAE